MKHAIDSITNERAIRERLDVQIACALSLSLEEQCVNQFDDGPLALRAEKITIRFRKQAIEVSRRRVLFVSDFALMRVPCRCGVRIVDPARKAFGVHQTGRDVNSESHADIPDGRWAAPLRDQELLDFTVPSR